MSTVGKFARVVRPTDGVAVGGGFRQFSVPCLYGEGGRLMSDGTALRLSGSRREITMKPAVRRRLGNSEGANWCLGPKSRICRSSNFAGSAVASNTANRNERI